MSLYGAWKWNRQIPSTIASRIPRKNRTPKVIDAFFRNSHSLDIKKIISFLGQPDGFSQQSMYSLTQGTKEPMRYGGTLRFLLNDGGEVHVSTHNFTQIDLALRWNRRGRNELLFK